MRRTPAHHRPHRRLAALLLAAVLAALATACGSDGTTDVADDTAAEDAGTAAEDDHDESFTFGEPADASEADRTIAIDALDSLAFDPEAVEVAAGEVVTFEVTNTGALLHEFVLGPEDFQEEHAAEMAEMAEGETMHDEPNAMTIPAGETASLTWHFTEEAGEILYGCHEPGHYDAGMVGTITVG